MTNLAKQIAKWTDAKIDKELAFARAARDDSDPNNVRWLATILAEDSRRANADIDALYQAVG